MSVQIKLYKVVEFIDTVCEAARMRASKIWRHKNVQITEDLDYRGYKNFR